MHRDMSITLSWNDRDRLDMRLMAFSRVLYNTAWLREFSWGQRVRGCTGRSRGWVALLWYVQIEFSYFVALKLWLAVQCHYDWSLLTSAGCTTRMHSRHAEDLECLGPQPSHIGTHHKHHTNCDLGNATCLSAIPTSFK
jgi:hypothetical protein